MVRSKGNVIVRDKSVLLQSETLTATTAQAYPVKLYT